MNAAATLILAALAPALVCFGAVSLLDSYRR